MKNAIVTMLAALPLVALAEAEPWQLVLEMDNEKPVPEQCEFRGRFQVDGKVEKILELVGDEVIDLKADAFVASEAISAPGASVFQKNRVTVIGTAYYCATGLIHF